MGLKLTYSINDLMDKYEVNKESLSVCEDLTKNKIWDSEIKRLVNGLTEHKKEMARKGDISSELLDFGVSHKEKHLNQKELCSRLDEKVSEEESCYLPRSYLEKLKQTDFAKLKFKEVCVQNLPTLYKLYKGCRRNGGKR